VKSIEVSHVTVDIPVFDSSRSLRREFCSRFLGGEVARTSDKHVRVRALDDISFKLVEGDRLGLIGHNGSGKSTLLNVLSRIYMPERGMVKINGKVTPLFNVTLGLDSDDTGYQNIYTIGMYYGLSKAELDLRREDIIEFSELGDFIHLPVRTYSSGMLLRLSFAIVTSMRPDILVIDEGIGAGDAQFTKKAKARLENFYEGLSIMVMASHSNDLIKSMCNKAMLLERGKCLKIGDVDEVLELYAQRDLV